MFKCNSFQLIILLTSKIKYGLNSNMQTRKLVRIDGCFHDNNNLLCLPPWGCYFKRSSHRVKENICGEVTYVVIYCKCEDWTRRSFPSVNLNDLKTEL